MITLIYITIAIIVFIFIIEIFKVSNEYISQIDIVWFIIISIIWIISVPIVIFLFVADKLVNYINKGVDND